MSDTTLTESRVMLEGYLPLWMVVVLGLGLIGLSVGFFRREVRLADRPRWMRLFLGFRIVVILILLWMLAGPTRVTTTRSTHPRTVTVFVDQSASMGLVDVPDGSGNVLRWAARAGLGGVEEDVRKLDATVATLRSAQRQLERFARLPDVPRDNGTAREDLSRAVQCLREGATLLHAAKSILEAEPASAAGSSTGGVRSALRTIEERVLPELEARESEFRRGKTLASLDRAAWLPDRLGQLAMAVQRVDQLAEERVRAVESASGMAGGGATEDSRHSRFEKVESLLAEAESDWLGDVRSQARVERFDFGEKVIPRGAGQGKAVATAGSGQGPVFSRSTQLGSALQQATLAQSARDVAAVILLTDGGHNAGRDPREIAPGLAGTPLHIVPIGNTRLQRDVILHHTHAPRAVLQNDQVVVDALVTAYDCATEQLKVELVDGDRVVDHQILTVRGEVHDSRVQLRWKAEVLGRRSLQMRVIPVSDERSEDNNSAALELLVMEDRIRVLVADHFPRWETRYLINLFRRDERIEFDQFLVEPAPADGDGMRSVLPSGVTEWSRYRVVILGDLRPDQLTPSIQRDLRDYLTEAGGNVILVAGRDAMPAAYRDQPLGAILPVEPGSSALRRNTPFQLELTDEGAFSLATQIAETPDASERVWREASQRLPVYSLSEFSQLKPTAHSLIRAVSMDSVGKQDATDPRSFLAWQYVGAGRLVCLAAPVTHQLRYRQGDAYHHRFWGQLLRWVVARDLAEGSVTVRLSTDKSRYEEGESPVVSVRLRELDGRAVTGAVVDVMALQGSQVLQQLDLREDRERPGVYSASLMSLPTGTIRFRVEGARVRALLAEEGYSRAVETDVQVDPSGDLELRNPLCNLALLREIADASGGQVVGPSGLAAAMRQVRLDPKVHEEAVRMPLWNRWDLFWIFIVCLTLEWVGRKWVGLP